MSTSSLTKVAVILCLLCLEVQMIKGEVLERNRRDAHPHMNNLVYGRRSAPSTIVATGRLDKPEVRSVEFAPDAAEGEMNRRAVHPHMNNLVYGRRSDPAADGLSDVVCRKAISRCARWQRQFVSEAD